MSDTTTVDGVCKVRTALLKLQDDPEKFKKSELAAFVRAGLEMFHQRSPGVKPIIHYGEWELVLIDPEHMRNGHVVPEEPEHLRVHFSMRRP